MMKIRPKMSTTKDSRIKWRDHKRKARDLELAADLRVGLVATFTLDPVEPYLGSNLLAHGFCHPEITFADYNQIMQVCFDWKKHFHENTNVIGLFWNISDLLGETQFSVDLNKVTETVNAVTEELISGIHALRADFPGMIIVNIPTIPSNLHCDLAQLGGVPFAKLAWSNALLSLYEGVADLPNIQICDMEAISGKLGQIEATDERNRLMFRQPFGEIFFSEMGLHLSRLIRVKSFEAKKCIILDCDNTLWGGVVGEAEIGGIKLGQDFPGRAFTEFQKIIKTLKESGILLAICSKNNFEDAHIVFREHDEMILKENDIAVFKINWELKSQNIVQIADELNIGTNSLVFIDDSKYEISEVNNTLPEVTTILVPEDIGEFPNKIIENLHLFDRQKITEDDKLRADRIRQEVGRKKASSKLSREDFLKSLKLELSYFEPNTKETDRTTQLVNKTNQFNLTTKRMELAEVQAYVNNAEKFIRCIRVKDRFGDYGLVGTVVVRVNGTEAYIDNLLMSCRVLGRGIETAFISTFLEELSEMGVNDVFGAFSPSPKNQQVENLLGDNGFSKVDKPKAYQSLKDGTVYWKINPSKRSDIAVFLRVNKS